MALNSNKHRQILYALLGVLTKSSYKSMLGFKGGTLAYFLYHLPRFSTDLDFDLLEKVDDSKMLEDLTVLCQPYGTIKDAYNKEHTIFLLIDYGYHEANIKIEINKRTRQNDHFSYQTIFGHHVLCMDRNDLFTNKLVALCERKKTASRDLFDIHFFFSQGREINNDLLYERTGKSICHYLSEVKTFISNHFNSNNVLAGLGELIDDKQKYFVKTNLIKETLHIIDLYLASYSTQKY